MSEAGPSAVAGEVDSEEGEFAANVGVDVGCLSPDADVAGTVGDDGGPEQLVPIRGRDRERCDHNRASRQLALLTTQQRQAFCLVEMAPPAPCRSRSARSLAVRRGVTRIQSPTLLLLSPPIPLATRSTHSLDYPLLVLSL